RCRRRRRSARPGGARACAQAVLRQEQASAQERAARHREQPHRRPRLRPRGHQRREAARERDPLPLDEAVLDYHVLGESVDADGTVMQRVLLVVAYRELVERYVSACKKAGITLAGVDLEAFALLRALG